MGLIRRGGGGGDEDDGGGDSLGLGDDHKRCEVCRREMLPWQDTCPDDGGRGVAPGTLGATHDPLLARLLAEDEAEDEAAGGTADGATAGDDAPDDVPLDEPVWPSGGDGPA